MQDKKYKILLGIIVLVFITMNYTLLNSFLVKNFSNEEFVRVDRVIDGDTVVVNGTSVRMLGINTPERGEKYYAEAKNYTESLVLNKTIKIEKRGKDLYNRDLAYLFYSNENINLALVKEGYANYYFPEGKDNYYSEFVSAWEQCIGKNINLCRKSPDKCAECIELREWDFESQKVVFYNSCNIDCNMNKWTIKDEGRKKFVFQNFTLENNKYVYVIVENKTDTSEKLYWKGETYVWTKTGDT
ncbi:MAG: thermonuclease family protein, partial [Candidatus Diapherotrites archaeon]